MTETKSGKQAPTSTESDGPKTTTSDTSISIEETKLTPREAALAYATNGWPVFPLHTPMGDHCSCGGTDCKIGKHPRTPHGLKEATTDPTTIAKWWSTWPDANIGLRLDGALVLDVDPRNGGDEALAALEKEHSPLALRARQRSGSGGYHYLFAPCEELTAKKTGFRPGLDLLTGSGCYICVEPSLHTSGDKYKWTDEPHPLSKHRESILLVTPPTWLLDVVLKRNVKSATQRAANDAGPSERKELQFILDEFIARITGAGMRNNTDAGFFCAVRDNGYSPEEAADILPEWVQRANEADPTIPPYTLKEAESTLKSIYSKPPRKIKESGDKKPTIIEVLEELSQDIEMFHTSKGQAFARYL
jgi:hypothetical protein